MQTYSNKDDNVVPISVLSEEAYRKYLIRRLQEKLKDQAFRDHYLEEIEDDERRYYSNGY